MILPSVINTSNINKQREFKNLFENYNHVISFINKDVNEIIADPITVIVHKAISVGDTIFVEDTSLDVVGHDFGIAIKHKVNELANAIGCKAVWNVYMAFCQQNTVFIFKGSVAGVISSKKGESGFGFDPYFIPDSCTKTLAEEKLNQYNARALCVDAIMHGNMFAIESATIDFEKYRLQSDNY